MQISLSRIVTFLYLSEIVKAKMLKSINAEGTWEWSCTDCDYKSIHATTVKRHVESKHIGKSYISNVGPSTHKLALLLLLTLRE